MKTKTQKLQNFVTSKHDAFTLAEGGRSPLLNLRRNAKHAFTLAEVLITLGVIGVVAAVTMPTLVTNIQERINKEKVRTVKYKLTLATDKMKALDKIGPYATTEKFLNELKQHMSIAKICDKDHLAECWPSEKINLTDSTKNVSDIKTGQDLMALALGTSATDTMGIVTGDGTPMILVYSPVCTPLDPAKSYTWSVVDGKPETNASTNCVSAIFDINGAKGPNKLGKDVRTLNSIFGYKKLGATYISKNECLKRKNELGINECYNGNDYWAGAVKACHELGLHLPSPQTLANIAGARYGRSDIGPYTLIMKNGYTSGGTTYQNCRDYYEAVDASYNYRLARSEVICVGDGNSNIPLGTNTTVRGITGDFWSSAEVSAQRAIKRDINDDNSSWRERYRYTNNLVPLCLAD